jgi:hypothetical protein
MLVPFGKWRPDVFDLDTGVAGDASGVLPASNSKAAWPSLVPFSEALTEDIRGAFFARKSDGSVAIYVGTETGLFLYTGSGTAWTDVSQSPYALPDGDRWSFAQFGTNLVACNIAANPQKLDIDAGSAAVDLGGSPPKARRVATIGDHLWLLSTEVDQAMVTWSGTNDCEWWTLGERDCDEQLFPDGGEVTGITSLETGLIFQMGCVRRFTATADRLIYTFNQLDDNRGLIAPDSLVSKGGVAYFLSEEGFVATAGDGSTSAIGFEQVDKWFQGTADQSNLYAVTGCVDPLRNRIFWMFPAGGTNPTLMNICLCYDIALQEWTYATFDAYLLVPGATVGTTLEGLDALGYTLDTLPFSLDSRQFVGGAPLLAGFGADKTLGFFSGANMAARVETGEFQASPPIRAFVRSVLPLTEAATATAQVGARENLQSARSWGASSPINAQGRCPTRSSGRFHRVRLSIPAGAAWTHAAGVDVDATSDGQR